MAPHASNSTFAFLLRERLFGVRRLDAALLFSSFPYPTESAVKPAHSKLLPRFGRNLQSHSLTAPNQFDFVFLAGFHLA